MPSRKPNVRPSSKTRLASPKRNGRKAATAKARKVRPEFRSYADLNIGEEQVCSNECWAPSDETVTALRLYSVPAIGDERVTSNECYAAEGE